MKKCNMLYSAIGLLLVGAIFVAKSDRAFIPVYSSQGYVYESDKNGLRVIIKQPTEKEEKAFFNKDVHILARHDIVPLYIFATNTSDSSQTVSLDDLNLPIVDLKTVSAVINKKLIPTGTVLSLEMGLLGSFLTGMFTVKSYMGLASAGFFLLSLAMIVPTAITLGIFIKKIVDACKAKNNFKMHLCPKIIHIEPGETYCGITFIKKFDPSFL